MTVSWALLELSAAAVIEFCSLSSLSSWLDAEASEENYEALEYWFAKCGPWTNNSWNLFEMQILRPPHYGGGGVGAGLSNLCVNKALWLPRWPSDRIRLPMQEIQDTRFHPRFWKIPWRRKWQPTPVFLPGKSHGLRSLEGYSPWSRKESHTHGT